MKMIQKLTRDIERLELKIEDLEYRMDKYKEDMRKGRMSKADYQDKKRKFKVEVVGLRGAIKKKEKARLVRERYLKEKADEEEEKAEKEKAARPARRRRGDPTLPAPAPRADEEVLR